MADEQAIAYVVPVSHAARKMKEAEDRKRILEAKISSATTEREQLEAAFELKQFMRDGYAQAEANVKAAHEDEVARAAALVEARAIYARLEADKAKDPFQRWEEDQATKRADQAREAQKTDWLQAAKEGRELT